MIVCELLAETDALSILFNPGHYEHEIAHRFFHEHHIDKVWKISILDESAHRLCDVIDVDICDGITTASVASHGSHHVLSSVADGLEQS